MGIQMASMDVRAVLDLKLKEAMERQRTWIASPEGRKAIQEALRVAKERTEYLRKARAVPFELLHEPFTL